MLKKNISPDRLILLPASYSTNNRFSVLISRRLSTPSVMFHLLEHGETLNRTFEKSEVEWAISDYSSVVEFSKKRDVESPFFLFADEPWYFKLKTEAPASGPVRMRFLLVNKNDCDYAVQYTCGLKKQDGVVENISNGIWKEDHAVGCMEIKEVEERKSELAAKDVLTFTCILKRETSQPTDQSDVEELIKLNTLSDNFRSLYANKENCDTTLLVQGKEYKAHEAVLVARSSVFADMFQHNTSVKQTRVITIPDCDSGTFQQFLEFIYCGKLGKISFCSAIHLYQTSHKYDVQELKAFCVDSLVENMTEENFREVVILADKYGDARLFSAVQGFFNKDPSKIMDTTEWKCLLENNYDLAKELLKGMATKFNELHIGNYKYDDEV